jgi:hypothetical protein
MTLVIEKNEHLYYSSTDKNFCNAPPYHFIKITKSPKNKIIKKINPLVQYRKKLLLELEK